MRTAFDRQVEAYRRTTDMLLLVERHIVGDVHAAFKLQGPDNSLIMPTWITVLPNGYVSVIGDLTNVIFNCHGSRTWRSSLSRLVRPNGTFDSYYIGQKATMGMSGFDVYEFTQEYAQEDLLQYFLENARDSRAMGQPSIGAPKRRQIWDWSDNEYELYDALSDVGHDDYDLGKRLRGPVIAGALAMERLTKILDDEEQAA